MNDRIQEIKTSANNLERVVSERPEYRIEAMKVLQDYIYLLSEVERLQEENKVMKRELEWYANKDRYYVRPYGLDPNDFYPAEIIDDKGLRARTALSHLKG